MQDAAEHLGGSVLIESRMTSVPAVIVMQQRDCAEEMVVLRFRLPFRSRRELSAQVTQGRIISAQLGDLCSTSEYDQLARFI